MDTVTQAVFGAVIGQAGFQSKLGWRALAAGAALATAPDLDVFASLSDPFNEWRHHRGITHSLFFGPFVGPLFGFAIWKFYRLSKERAPGKRPSGLDMAVGSGSDDAPDPGRADTLWHATAGTIFRPALCHQRHVDY